MTDYDLCMLEHLAYMNADEGLKSLTVEYKALDQCVNVGEYLNQFNTAELRNNSGHNTNGDEISRGEYAAIIDYMKSSEEICNLSYSSKMENQHESTATLAFDLKSASGEHYVIFKGSTGGVEWKDNAEGIGVSDTQSQKDALKFVERIDSYNITVVGHSKGGNKAMYCAVVSDKVSRCVSMDGQGFSNEFILKYENKINLKAQNITNISYYSDFVHPLMYPVPGSSQKFTGGYYGSNGVSAFAECHSPNSIFTFETDENGVLIATGIFDFCDENKSVALIQGLTDYIMCSNCENKQAVISYLSYLIGRLGGNAEDFINKILNGDEVLDAEMTAQLVAYLLKYCNERNISADELYSLLLETHIVDDVEFYSLLQMIFNYIASNEDDQNYVILKGAVFVIDRFVDKDKKHDKLYDTLWKSLKKIKQKYESINYDPSRRVVTFNSKIKPITTLYNTIKEKSSPWVYYDLEGISSALDKMINVLKYDYVETSISCTENSGKAIETCIQLDNEYRHLYTQLKEVVQRTYNQVKAVYDAVYELESSM